MPRNRSEKHTGWPYVYLYALRDLMAAVHAAGESFERETIGGLGDSVQEALNRVNALRFDEYQCEYNAFDSLDDCHSWQQELNLVENICATQ